MPTDRVAVVRRFYELSLAADEACWELWAADAVSMPPPEWPEGAELRGVETIKRTVADWASAFGPRWLDGLGVDGVTALPGDRVLVDLAFEFEGGSSGAPVKQLGAAIYTVREGRIARAEHFMDRAAARKAAGLA
jgi:ketosteroid isomerase-like protein